jgi:hypothetical protein
MRPPNEKGGHRGPPLEEANGGWKPAAARRSYQPPPGPPQAPMSLRVASVSL